MILAKKIIRNFLNCESAVSEIIASIMLLAIAVSVIALVQTESVPEWNKEVEMDHSDVVYDDFLKMRSDIETAALFQFPKSGAIHMGAHYPGRLIFINPADTSGTLTSTNVTWINVSYKPFNQTPTYFNNSSTSIKFVPNYNYYSNAPSFVYEHGLVIKDFTIDNYIYTDTSQAIFGNNNINVIMLAYPQESVSSSGIKALNYNLQSKNSTGNNTNVTVTFYTNYPQLWNASLRKYNLNPIVSGNIVTVDYPGNITINFYTFNGSIDSGTGVSAITATPAPTITPAPNEYNYVFDFMNITGIVTDFENARNASDGAVSTFSEALVGENKSNISRNPVKTIITGTQSGTYNSSYLDSVDGNIDITRPNLRQIKTVVYYMGQRESATDLASGTNFTTGPVSVFLPEQGVVVKQAWLELWQLSGTTTTADVTALNMYLNGMDYSHITGGTYQAETGESLITVARANVTPAFSVFINPTTFTAAVKTGKAASNAQALMLYITYEYDSNSPAQLKTVRYPLDTNTGLRSAGSTTTFNYNVSIPEAATIRSSWFEIRGMIDSASTNDATIKAKIEPNATFSTGVSLDMADSDIYGFLYLFDTTSQFSENIRQTLTVQNLAQAVYALGGEIVVTYEYSNNAPVQLKTVKYFVGQKTATGGTALLSDYTTVFLPEQDVNVKSVWARVRSTYTTSTAGTQTIAGKIGGTTTISHAFTLDMNQKLIGDYMIIYNMTEAASSLVNNTLVFINNTFNNAAHGPPATELYITYLYDPNSTKELKTVEYLAGQSQVQASARNDNFNITIPERETIRRDAYIDYIVMSSDTTDFSTNSAVDTSFSSKTVNIDGTSDAITAGVLNNDLQDRITASSNIYAINYSTVSPASFSGIARLTYGFSKTYDLNVTYIFTEKNASATWQSISVNDNSFGDALTDVSILNVTSGAWEPIKTALFVGGTSPGEHVNVTIGANGNARNYNASDKIKLMYNWTAAATYNSLGINRINVTVNYIMSGTYKLNITTNTTDIPQTSNHTLQLRYNVSRDNFTLQLWNGSSWNNRITLNDTSLSYRNVTLLPNELILYSNAGGINKYYSLVRYMDVNASATQMGTLYLDYQRIYNS